MSWLSSTRRAPAARAYPQLTPIPTPPVPLRVLTDDRVGVRRRRLERAAPPSPVRARAHRASFPSAQLLLDAGRPRPLPRPAPVDPLCACVSRRAAVPARSPFASDGPFLSLADCVQEVGFATAILRRAPARAHARSSVRRPATSTCSTPTSPATTVRRAPCVLPCPATPFAHPPLRVRRRLPLRHPERVRFCLIRGAMIPRRLAAH